MESITACLPLHKSTLYQLQFQLAQQTLQLTRNDVGEPTALSESLHLWFISFAFVHLCVFECMCWCICVCYARAGEATAGGHRCTGSDHRSQASHNKLQLNAPVLPRRKRSTSPLAIQLHNGPRGQCRFRRSTAACSASSSDGSARVPRVHAVPQRRAPTPPVA